MSINDIKAGGRARVKGLLAHGTMRRRMLDIGLVNGAEVGRVRLLCGEPVPPRAESALAVLKAGLPG